MFDLAAAFHTPLVQVIGAIWLVLILASGLVAIISRRKPGAARELADRTRTWWWIIAIVSIVMILVAKTTAVFIAIVSFLAFREFHSVVPVRQADRIILA